MADINELVRKHRESIWENVCRFYQLNHGLFTNGWETRSRDVWKPVSNRTPGIISKLCKLGGGTPALLRPVGTLQDFALLDMGKNDSSSIK